MPLFSERQRRQEIARLEEDGVDLWTVDMNVQVRQKIVGIVELVAKDQWEDRSTWAVLRTTLTIDAGWPEAPVRPTDLLTYTNEADWFDILECLYKAMDHQSGSMTRRSALQTMVNEVLNSHRVAYKMIDGEFVPFTSDELHVEVVEPALRLLADRRFDDALAAYRKALKELAASDAGDAITDAGTALQVTLETLGCQGHSLGPLIKDAQKKNLLGSHDQKLADSIKAAMEWVSADRSTSGDGHKVGTSAVADAWLTVHIVGALIVRLADPSPRSPK